jgi:amino acid efflux transporter
VVRPARDPHARAIAANPGIAADDGRLRPTITLPQAVALYGGAVVGAGVLILPGVAAGEAGPASLVAWVFDGLLGIPIAFTFAALAARFPGAGGVAAYASIAFGDAAGAVAGWFYFFAASIAQALVTLSGAHYVADAVGFGRGASFALAGGMVLLAVTANVRGLRVSARVQLALAGGVAVILVSAALVAIPRERLARLQPFLPHGWTAMAATTVTLLFAFFGWEAITHLSGEFRDPQRDVPRATLISVVLVTCIYFGVAFAVVATGTYGGRALDRVAVAHVLATSIGVGARSVAAAAAFVISLGTANAFVAATSRLGYALGRDDMFPSWMGGLNADAVPVPAILAVGAIASAGLVLGYLRGWGAEAFLVVPNSLVIVVYVAAMAAGVRLLAGRARLLAGVAAVLCAAVVPFVGVALVLPVGLGAAAVCYRVVRLHRRD